MTTGYHIVLLALIINHVDGNTFKDNSTTEKIENKLASSEAQQFLANYTNIDQRYIIEQQLRYCPYTPLCGYSFGMAVYMPFTKSCCRECSCDINRCRRSKSCCPDLEDLPAGMPLDVIPPKMECHLTHLVKKKGFGYQEAIYMFATCPGSANKTMQRLCVRSYGDDDVSHFSDLVPVTRKNDKNVYRNKFCAFCNNLTENEINYWYPKTTCKHGSSITIEGEKAVIKDMYGHVNCNLAFEPQHEAFMQECTKAISTCNQTGLWKTYDPFLEKACSFYIAVHHQTKVYDDVYSNIFCMMCNGREPIKYQCVLPDKPLGIDSSSYSFTGLLDFSFFQDTIGQSKPEDCSVGSMFDPYQRQCRDLHCSPFRKLKNGECFKLFSMVTDIVYVVYIRLVPHDVISVSTAHALAAKALSRLSGQIYNAAWIPNELNDTTTICQGQLFYKTDLDMTNKTDMVHVNESTLLYYYIKFEIDKKKLNDPDLVNIRLMQIDNKTSTLILNNEIFSFTTSLRDDTDEWFDYFNYISRQRYWNDSVPYRYIWPPPLISDMVSEAVPDTDGKMMLPYIRINDFFNLPCYPTGKTRLKVTTIKPCTMFKLTYSRFDNEQTVDGILFTKRHYLLKNSDFYYNNASKDAIFVCTDTYFKFAEQIQIVRFNYLDAEMVVSIVCVSLSVLALLVTLTTFSLFPQLRTLPGQNNISLVVSLLIAQTMYLIGSFGPIPVGSVTCKVIGVVVHFCWLHSVCWMNACTYHMFYVFFKVRQIVNESSPKRLLIYHLYCIAVPTGMVIINVTVSLLSSNNHDIGYGTVMCYITSSQMVGFTFGIPVAVLLVANITMFIVVAVKITDTDVKHNRDNLAIIMKLSTLTGITWTFGFIFAFTKATVVSYIFVVLNASQGVLLMISFVLNKRVKDMYREKFFSVANVQDSSVVKVPG